MLYSHKNPAIVTKWNEWKTINIKTKGGFYSSCLNISLEDDTQCVKWNVPN